MPTDPSTGNAQLARRDVAKDADALRELHRPGDPLLLANIWDPPTAMVAAAAGARAIATASAAIAPANGYEDHGKLPPEVAFAAIRRIADAVQLPITADLEDGYGLSAEELAVRLIDAGAAGLNLEDSDHSNGGLVDPSWQAERIAAVKSAGRALGVDLMINARVDVHLHGGSPDDGIRRAVQYREAGANCIYPILLSDLAALREYVAIAPTNALARPNGPLLSKLVGVGVSRISVGPFMHRLMLERLQSAIEAYYRLDDENAWGVRS